MKWLLITGVLNPGDCWARMGIEELILAVDPEARFIQVDKEIDGLKTRIECDRAVFCGQPLIWSHPDHSTPMVSWWEDLLGWPVENRKLIVAGYGVCLWYDKLNKPQKHKWDWVSNAVKDLLGASRSHYARSSDIGDYLGEGYPHSLCPSVFAGRHLRATHDLNVCNLMPGGSHFSFQNPARAKQWQKLEPKIAAILLKAGFAFIAHNATERDLALRYGWTDANLIVHDGNPRTLLYHYSRTQKYFGNRVHGALVSRSFRAEVVLCHYDTRSEAVWDAGGDCILPEDLELDWLEGWANSPCSEATVRRKDSAVWVPMFDIDRAWKDQLEFFR